MSHMNSWDSQRPQDVSCILSSLANARMPVFKLMSGHLRNAGLMISGNELPMIMNFPRKKCMWGIGSQNGIIWVEMCIIHPR